MRNILPPPAADPRAAVRSRAPPTGWETATLLDAISRIVDTGDTDVQRGLFAEMEAKARKAGHAKTLDGWGDDLHLMRPV